MGKIKPYVKTDWVPGLTPVTRENMTNIEEQVESITNVLVEASSTDKSAGAIVVRNSEGKVEGDIAGNSGTTTKFDKKKLLKVTGVVNGQVQFDGSEEGDKIEIATTLDKGYQQLLDQKLECFLNTKHMQGCPTLRLGQYCYVINDIVVDGSRLYEVIDYAGEVKLDNGLWARMIPRKTITGDLNDLMFALTEKILEGLNQLEGVVLAIRTEKNSALTAVNSDKLTALSDIALARGSALGTLEQYMHAAENGGNANSVQGYVPRNFKRTEDTIADLVSSASNKYRIGDIVELNGYYTAGDGAGHKRKIEATNDGSGILLANGLYANIVHSGEVNVSWFGAKGNGITDDTVPLKKATELNVKTISDFNKQYLVTDTIVFGAEADFNNSTIKSSTPNIILVKTESSFKNLRLFLDSDFNNTGFRCDVQHGPYPSQVELENIKVISNMNNFEGTLFQVSVHQNWNVKIKNITLGREDFGMTTYCKKSFSLITETNDDWVTCSSIENITSDCYALESQFEYSNFRLNSGSNSFRNIFIQSKWKTGVTQKKVVHIKNSNRDSFENFKIFDYDVSWYTESKMVLFEVCNWTNFYGFCDIHPTLGHVGTSGQCLGVFNSNISNYLTPFKKGQFNVSGDVGKYYPVKFKASAWDDFGSLEIYSILDYADNTREGYLKLDFKATENFENFRKAIMTKIGVDSLGLGLVNRIVVANGWVVIWLKKGRYWVRSMSSDGSYKQCLEGEIIPLRNGSITVTSNTNPPITFEGVQLIGEDYAQTLDLTSLDTPYHATKMQQEGVYEDFIQYMDSKTEYDRLQREAEKQPEGVMMLPVIEEPQPSEALLKFKEKYLG